MKSLLLLCLLCHVWSSASSVKVEEGELTGTTYTLQNGRVVNAFYGVPYAAPPVKKHRFKEPQHLKPWVGVWNASVPPSACLQYAHHLYDIVGEEDCLYLNIYTPKLPINGVSPLLNVLVYFHGGAFMFGTGVTIYPDYIMKEEDLVYVTVNYRVGVLGFFSLGDNVIPGNYGLKDQVAALKWIQHNIIQFGGNPAAITIAGCSAGGASVHYHYLSPLSDGLFQKGISMSGSVLLPWTLPRNVTEKSVQVGSLVGCPVTNSTRDLLKCLQKRPAKQLIEAVKNFLKWRYNPFTVFGPVVEPQSPGAFLTASPLELLKTGKVKDLPWLISVTEKEGLYPGADFLPHDAVINELNDKWNEIAPHLLMYNYTVPESEKDAVSAAIKQYYFGEKPISKETSNELIQALGDRLFYNDIMDATKLHSSITQTNIYCYKFKYRGRYSLTNKYAKDDIDYGCSHSDDLTYVVNYLGTNSEETKSDAAMVKLMTSQFIAFMKTGNPNTGLVDWQPVTKDINANVQCLSISNGTSVVMEEVFNSTVNLFWKNLLPVEYPPEGTVLKDEL